MDGEGHLLAEDVSKSLPLSEVEIWAPSAGFCEDQRTGKMPTHFICRVNG